MFSKLKKLFIATSLVGASAFATYGALKMVDSIRELDSLIVATDYSDLRKEARHYSEMVEMMKRDTNK